MKSLRLAGVALALVIGAGQIVLGQVDPNNVPKPPGAELAKLKPFLGLYEHTMDFAGLGWRTSYGSAVSIAELFSPLFNLSKFAGWEGG